MDGSAVGCLTLQVARAEIKFIFRFLFLGHIFMIVLVSY